MRVLHAGDLRADGRFAGVIEWLAGRCALLYLHVDLDVLDPRFVPSASTPSADGLSIDEAVAAMTTVLQTGKVAAVTISSLNPGAGARGERSVASAMKLLEGALPAWTATPAGGNRGVKFAVVRRLEPMLNFAAVPGIRALSIVTR